MLPQKTNNSVKDALRLRIEDAVLDGDEISLRAAQFELYQLGEAFKIVPLGAVRHALLRRIYRLQPGASDLDDGFDEFAIRLRQSELQFDGSGDFQPHVQEAIQVGMNFWSDMAISRIELEQNIATSLGLHPLHMGMLRQYLDECISHRIETLVGCSRWVLKVVEGELHEFMDEYDGEHKSLRQRTTFA